LKKVYPKWSELPTIDLYLDQVLLYVNQLDSSSIVDDDKGLTAAMINNYVKNGHLDKPIKKKYSRRQLARLIVITCLKNVFAIQEISKTISSLTKDGDSEAMYDNFVMCMNEEKREGLPEVIVSACDTVRLYKKTHDLVEKLK
jgi:BS_ykrK family protein